MIEVKRYARMGELVEATSALLKLYPAMTVYVLGDDFDRVTAERDALQLLLNERDEQVHSLEQRRQAEQQACQAAEREAVRYRFLRKVTPYRFKKMQDTATTDGGDVFYFHADRFDAAIDALLNK
ncbi:hypothetical protein [Pseudomonas sp. S3_B08]